MPAHCWRWFDEVGVIKTFAASVPYVLMGKRKKFCKKALTFYSRYGNITKYFEEHPGKEIPESSKKRSTIRKTSVGTKTDRKKI